VPSDFDLDREWPRRLRRAAERSSEQIALPAGGEGLSRESPREEVIAWTCSAYDVLEERVGARGARAMLAECACHYPVGDLEDLRAEYAANGDLHAVHARLRFRFDRFLREDLALGPELIARIEELGMGMAGQIDGDRIVAVKIPSSGHLRAWFAESDSAERRRLYCHCPRVRDAALEPGRVPPGYCWCGAGFYKGIWETILGRPVRVESLGSVLQGDEVCTVAIWPDAEG